MRTLCALLLLGTSHGWKTSSDLTRASTKKPRAEFRGSGVSMSTVLNGHLARLFPEATPCESWSLADLQALQRELHAHRNHELDAIYAETKDKRSLGSSLADHEQQWRELREFADGCAECELVLRDGHCHEAVMWLVHHVPQKVQQIAFASRAVPMLPRRIHKPDALGSTSAAEAVMHKYREQYTCQACHMTGPALPEGSDPLAPKWPAPLPPQFPQQFHSLVDGWQVGGREGGFNYTGEWHYDFNNNRFRQEVNVTAGPAKGMTMVQLWLGTPTPDDEEQSAEKLYGKNASRGNLYIFMKFSPAAPAICSRNAYPFSVVHPDALSWGPNYQGVDVPTSKFFGREFVRGQWADHYGLWFNTSYVNCSGPFEIWRSVKEGVPVMDYGVGNCGSPTPMAQTHWQKMIREEPALNLFQSDFSSCKDTADDDEVERLALASDKLAGNSSPEEFAKAVRVVVAHAKHRFAVPQRGGQALVV